MPEPPQPTPLDVAEQQLYSEPLLDDRAPEIISKATFKQAMENCSYPDFVFLTFQSESKHVDSDTNILVKDTAQTP